jgi:hypothetical protein
VQTDVDQPALQLTTVNAMRIEKTLRNVKPAETGATHQVMHLNEKKVFPLDCDDERDVWVLDTHGAII